MNACVRRRYEEQQARREELRFFLKTVHKAVINAAKGAWLIGMRLLVLCPAAP